MQTYNEYYNNIIQPSFAPPEWVFGLAWGIIYPLIAIVCVVLIVMVFKKKAPKGLLVLFLLNLAANLAFTPIILGLESILLATADIFIVLATLALFEFKIWRYSKTIFVLLLPYLLWGTFATVLQTAILVIN